MQSPPLRKPTVSGPTDVALLVERWLGRSGLGGRLEAMRLLQEWKTIVGEAVAAEVELIDLRDGALLLKTRSSTWRSEVNWNKKAILERCNSVLGKSLAHTIRFV